MSTNYSFLKKVINLIFGQSPQREKSSRRRIGFESLENRELLSVSPLLYSLYSLRYNTPDYFDTTSNNESNNESKETVIEYSDTELMNNSDDNLYGEFFEETNVTANLTDTEWHNIATTSTEADEECEFGGTVSASSETSEADERLGGVAVDISRTDDNPFHADSVTVKFSLTGTATPGVDYSVSGLTYNNENDWYEGEIIIPYYVTSTTYTIGILNDAITESSETVIFTLISVYNSDYDIDSGNVTVTIIDDDDWEITGSGGDSIWERAPYDDLPFGEFTVTRSGGPDRTYGITTEFVLSGSATPGVDYHLSWTNANDWETVIPVSQDNGVWKGSVYFPANSTDDEIIIYVIPNNDALPEDNETVTLTVTNAYANSQYPFNASGSGTFTIKDDDKWKVSVETTDDTATERLSDVVQDYGEFKFIKTFSGEGEGDQSYGITAVFDMIYDSGDPMSAQYGNDYSLQYQNTSGQWVSFGTPQVIQTNTISRYRFSVTIPAGQTEVKVRLVPSFDWEDEAELFDPFGGGSPKDDEGEHANFELISASWSGMGDNWDPIGDDTEGEIEIKDGAFVSVTSDFNNDGTIDNTDYDARHGDVGSLVVRNANDIAQYYAWIDVLGSNVYDLNFTGAGGIAYVSNYNEEDGNNYGTGTLETLYDGHNLATGTVEVVGAWNSPTVTSGSLS
ncbi:MAG: hypothetical protein LBK82_10465, partial [Planctomycetaceae bacterium]|nr:hypothetical protein [Planctomycetaceae bacterium]